MTVSRALARRYDCAGCDRDVHMSAATKPNITPPMKGADQMPSTVDDVLTCRVTGFGRGRLGDDERADRRRRDEQHQRREEVPREPGAEVGDDHARGTRRGGRGLRSGGNLAREREVPLRPRGSPPSRSC